MPEIEFHDLAEKPAEALTETPGKAPKPYYHTLPITMEQIPELEDYGLNDEVHLHIVCEVTQLSKEKDKPKQLTLTMRKGKVINLTEKRQKALRMGVKKETLDEIEGDESE